ncbi:MAG: helix-hairpin-helix domain-containing protein [Ignavibacteriae bacterium]|nr:helix-hairpin-helix domain-containing protein [Ignavibacteriota bacterium]
MKNFIKIFALYFITQITIYSQIDSAEVIDANIFELTESLFENNEDISSYDLVNQLLSNPIDINKTTVNELTNLPFLTLQDAQTIIKQRDKIKYFNSFNDFNTIKGVHPDVLLLMKPFVVFNIPDEKVERKITGVSVNIHSRLFSDLQNERGYLDKSYLGSKIKSYNKIGATFGNFRSRILVEKDAGESSFIDYISGFVEYKNESVIEKIIVGDYDFEFGQGLAIWSPYGYSKGSDAVNSISKRARGISAHTSSDENKFFRGLALESKLGNFQITAFASNNKKDATINDNDLVSNFVISGYHRTENEYSKLDNLTETTYGGSINYSLIDLFNVGILHINSAYNKYLDFGNNFSLNGNKFQFTSLSYNFYFNRLNVLGEVAYNGEAIATVANIFLGLSDNVQFVTTYRNYPKNYFNIFSNGFGETNNTQNENGFYFGVRINSDYGKFNIYYDIFNFPYSNYTNGFSSNGNDFLFNYENKLARNVKLNLKVKDEIKEIFVSENFRQIIGSTEKLNIRGTLDYNFSKSIFGKSRIEYVKFNEQNKLEEGYLLFQDVKFKFSDYFALTSRIIFFQTESYNSRIYEFENDLRGVLSNSPLFGEGLRFYLLFNFKPTNNFYIYLKYSETYKPNIKGSGSGYAEINGNLDNKISAQFDYRF